MAKQRIVYSFHALKTVNILSSHKRRRYQSHSYLINVIETSKQEILVTICNRIKIRQIGFKRSSQMFNVFSYF